jgi:threonyl-tRNA synthetase
MEKVPYVFIIGEKEKEACSVTVRSRCQPKHAGTHTLESVLQVLQLEIKERALPQKMQLK